MIDKHLILTRFAYSPFGTFGNLKFDGFECFTLELPWENNAPDISCIPEGDYEMKLTIFWQGAYDAYELINVPGRRQIKIHIGNTIDDIKGCIALGGELGWMKNKWAILWSQRVYQKFMSAMGRVETAKILITHKEF